ncbi:hypothetical protein [Gracilimonas sp.]|uniref:hypothetical protein n=1 Tax=Gracilimonas sp. TaxID=1974203 RepID=UPI0032ECF06C
MKHLIYYFLLAVFFIGCEVPNFYRNNPNDAGSKSFIPDSVTNLKAEITDRLSYPFHVNDVVRLSWSDESEFEKGFRILRKGPIDERILIAELPPNKTSITDTVKKGGHYVYEVQTVGTESSSSSFKVLEVSHIVEGPKMTTDKSLSGTYLVPLKDFNYLVTAQNVNSRIQPEIYNFETNSWNVTDFPSTASSFTAYLQPDHNIVIGMDKYEYFYYNVNTKSASSKKYFSELNNNWSRKNFHSVYFDQENILIVTIHSDEVYLFNPLEQTLNKLSSMNFEYSTNFSLVKISDEEALAVGSEKIKKFDLKKRNWETLTDLEFTLTDPVTIKINEEEILIFDRNNSSGDTKYPIYRYNFREKSYHLSAYLENRPIYIYNPAYNSVTFKLDNGTILIFTKNSSTYQIYNPSNEKVSRPIRSFIYRDIVGSAKLPNGAFLIPTYYYNSHFFRLDSE